jgi:hypothetical protein
MQILLYTYRHCTLTALSLHSHCTYSLHSHCTYSLHSHCTYSLHSHCALTALSQSNKLEAEGAALIANALVSNRWALHSLYTALTVHCTHCTLHSLYTALTAPGLEQLPARALSLTTHCTCTHCTWYRTAPSACSPSGATVSAHATDLWPTPYSVTPPSPR